VADQHPARVAARGGDVAADVGADQVLVPPGRVEQPLHAVRVVSPACSFGVMAMASGNATPAEIVGPALLVLVLIAVTVPASKPTT
jgi:hypothetical protein